MPVKLASSPRPGLGVEALAVTGLGDVEAAVDEHLDELAGLEQVAGHAPLGAERRDERHQHDEPGVDHEPGHLGDPADVLDPVGVGEAEVVVEAVAHVVAVEQVGVAPELVELLLDEVGDGRLAGAREAGEPDDGRLLAVDDRAGRLVDLDRLPVHVVGPAQREVQQAGGDGGVGEPVDEDEAAHVAVRRRRGRTAPGGRG